MNPQKPTSTAKLKEFRRTVWDYYKKQGRHTLPWRKTRDPYKILVSEIMLQQTQVSRVMTKWSEFLVKFPTVEALAEAPVADVLKAWQGLGYNRRALNLRRAAEVVVRDHHGQFPRAATDLESLPGIGQSTRGAIMAFAFGLPTTFIETNIRAIYIHHFFPQARVGAKNGSPTLVHDRDLLPLIEKTLDRENPRDWYYALMDYGVHLKQTLPNPSRKSLHHTKQSSFKGSNREIRSRILKFVLDHPKHVTRTEIIKHIGYTKHDVGKNIDALVAEGFIQKPL